MFMFDTVPTMYRMTQQAMVYNNELSVTIARKEHIVYTANVFLQNKMEWHAIKTVNASLGLAVLIMCA